MDEPSEVRRFRRHYTVIPDPEAPDSFRAHAHRSVRRTYALNLPPRFHRSWLVRRILGTSAGADSLRFYFTGAASDGAAQATQAGSLGNFRSSTEAARVGFFVSTPIPNVQILQASRFNAVEDVGGIGLGMGSLFAVGPNTLGYVSPDGTQGSNVVIANGESKTLTGSNSSYIRVQRTTAAQLAGGEAIEFVDLFNNVVGMSNAPEAQSSAGGSRYRGVMLRNDFTAAITLLKLYVKPLRTTHVVSSGGGLGGAGAGTITGPTDGFCSWEQKGWARVEDSGGTLKEIVYYSSRTDTVLTVPALGRGRLGTSATAGAGTDKVWHVPGIRIGFEPASPLINGSVQTIANESSNPASGGFTGGGWSSAITAATGVQVGTLNYQEQGALWIHRELPAGVSAIARVLNLVGATFLSDGIPCEETLAGMFRIADDDLKKYEIHIGVGAEPDLTAAPTETTATLPYDTTYVVPINTKVYVAVNYRNEYDLASQNMATTIIEVDGTQTEITPAPLPPTVIEWTPASGGTFHLLADYDITLDPHPGDFFRIYYTTNGATPTTADLLASVAIVRGGPTGRARLDYTTLTPVSAGVTGKVRVAIFRSSDSRLSDLSATSSAIAETAGPTAPSGVIGQKKSYQSDQH